MSIYYPNGPIPVTPLGPEDQQDLFYAHIDNENFDAAKKQAENLIKESPYLRRIYGSPTPQPNDNWLLGQSMLTQYYIAANELPEAEKLAEHLARTGSGNRGLRISYASVLEARGLPHAAEKELKLAEVIEPSNLELERQQAYVALISVNGGRPMNWTDDVIARSPDDEATLRLARIRDVHKCRKCALAAHKGSRPIARSAVRMTSTSILPFTVRQLTTTGDCLLDSTLLLANLRKVKASAAIWRRGRNGLPATTGQKWKSLAEIMAMVRKLAVVFPAGMTSMTTGA